jgi:hypothetical protein
MAIFLNSPIFLCYTWLKGGMTFKKRSQQKLQGDADKNLKGALLSHLI